MDTLDLMNPIDCKMEAKFCFVEEYAEDLAFFKEKLEEEVRAGHFYIILTDKNLNKYLRKGASQEFLENLLIYMRLRGFSIEFIEGSITPQFRIGWDITE